MHTHTMTQHHTSFHYKRFSSSEDTVQMNIHWNLNIHCDLDLEQDTRMMICHQTKFGFERVSSSENLDEISHNHFD